MSQDAHYLPRGAISVCSGSDSGVGTEHETKVNSPICRYVDIEELTSELLHGIVKQIKIGHLSHKSRLEKVIRIHWVLTT